MDNDTLKKLIQSQLPPGVDFDEVVSQFSDAFAQAPVEELEALLTADIDDAMLAVRAKLAREDSPEGFREFTWCISGLEMPLHVFYCWTVPAYYAHQSISWEQAKEYYEAPEAEPYKYVLDAMEAIQNEDTIGMVLYAAREMAKTTYMTVMWTAFRIGQQPHKSNIIVQIGDESAKRNAAKIALIIETYKGWKKVFPNVVPNKEKSWSASGYEVLDTSCDEEEWNKKNAMRQDVTLAGYGYTSGALIGKHPSGVLICDDIHNEVNTQSELEMSRVLQIVQSTLFYCMTDETWVTFVGTPWVEGDTLDFVANTSQYLAVKTPAYFHVENGKYHIADKWDDEAEKFYLWPEMRGERWVYRKYTGTIDSEFKRMVLLTIDMTGATVYQYSPYSSTDVSWQWPQRVGVDPTGTVEIVRGVDAGVSHFAMLAGLKTPYNNVVVAGGVVRKIDLEAGEREVISWQRRHPHARFAVETNNAGMAFISMINRTEGVQWDGYDVRSIGSGNKQKRQYDFLQAPLKTGLLVISDENSPALNMVRSYLHKFGRVKFAPDAPELDVGDALVLLLYSFPEVWMQTHPNYVNPMETFDEEEEQIDPLARMAASLR